MTRRTHARHALLAAALVLSGCAETRISPHAGQHPALEEDEVRLWSRSAEEQQRIDRSGFLAQVPAADAYLESVLARLRLPPLPGGASYRARIVVDPTLNAFAFPNGVIYIHTGMLARLDNEAQLSIVLAHEATHTVDRHGLRGLRNSKNATAFAASFTVGTAGLGALLGAVGGVASVSGYSKDLEREADQGGFRLMVAAGYDPREAPKAFQKLLEEAKRNQSREPFFFGSHPRLSERIASFEQLLAALPPERRSGTVGAAPYQAALQPVFLLNAGAALRAGDFDQVLASAQRALAVAPGDPHARLLIAEARRRRAKDDDLAAAEKLLVEITRDTPAFADAWRELGLVSLKRGHPEKAREHFARYLQLAPDAPDRAYLENLSP